MIKVLELFGGIGACSKALDNLGVEYEIADYVEIDKYAVKSFNAIHGTDFEPQDIMSWDKNIDVDLIMHGSPCQDFSVAGKNAGGDKGSGTRSSLMYETLRIVGKLKPKYVIWENVKNLLSKKHRHNFDAYQTAMQMLGYNSYYQVLNAKDYGLPQNRERIFTISIRNDGVFDSHFIFPDAVKLDKTISDIMDEKVDEKFYIKNDILKNVAFTKPKKIDKTKIIRVGGLYDNGESRHQAGSIYDPNGIAATLSTMQGGNQEPLVKIGDRVRKLTPKECWKIMGFSSDDFSKAEKVNSNSQLYKQAGNSICVPVLQAILKNLL